MHLLIKLEQNTPIKALRTKLLALKSVFWMIVNETKVQEAHEIEDGTMYIS